MGVKTFHRAMPRLFKRNLKLGGAALLILLAGTAAGIWRHAVVRSAIETRLSGEARRSALAVTAAELAALPAKGPDAGSATYSSVTERLRHLCSIEPGVRRIFILRRLTEGNRMIVLADSAPVAANASSQAGSSVAEAVMETGRSMVEGPQTDAFGTWVTAYVPFDFGSPGPVREILGLQVSADSWRLEPWQSGLSAAAGVWALFGLPLAAWLISRRQAEQREAIRNLSEAMEQSHSAVMIVDLQSRIAYANAGLCRQIGYERRELIGRPWRDFQVAETPLELLADLVATVRSGRSWTGEWFNRRKTGEIYPVRGVVTPVKHRDGTLASFVAVLDDMTEIKRTEAALREAKEHAEAGDRAKSQFLATMSHEVRTPLNGIVGFTNLLLETPLPPEPHEYVESIRTSAAALVQLTGDILDFARIESGKLKLEPLPCDPRECVEDALDLLAGPAALKRLELLHWIDREVPAVVVADAGRLRQVLVNLVGNAVKFTTAGEVEVKVTRAGGSLLEFSVRDTGPGIPPGQHHRLFKAFTQLDASTTRRHGGTGLGLAISRTLVQMMGGSISVASEPGRGATFTFTIQAPVYAESGETPLPAVSANERPLSGLTLALVARAPGLQREMERLAGDWGAKLVVVPEFEDLAGVAFHTALVDVGETLALRLAAQPADGSAGSAARPFGLVPLSLATSCRQALRAHFRLLINKPVHHASLLKLLQGRPSVSDGTRGTVPPFAHFAVRALLVEDNPVNQRLMQGVLTGLGCACDIVEDAAHALDELPRGRHQVVLLDLRGPETGGVEAIEKIRAGALGEEWRDVWVIAHAPAAVGDQRAKAMAAGADDFLAKPFRTADFAAALRKFLSVRAGRD